MIQKQRTTHLIYTRHINFWKKVKIMYNLCNPANNLVNIQCFFVINNKFCFPFELLNQTNVRRS